MIRDPFYREIEERLGGKLDPELFEQCAADLLRGDFPTLVPIRGGSDAGMDGAIADGEGPAFPLVSTTGKNVIGNLTRSLDSYMSEGGSRRRVVLATSQALTPKRRRNLIERAAEKGFELVQVYDRAAMADRLYRSPAWCLELLGLPGVPSALSAVPPTRRPLLGDAVVGRDEDLAWLRESDGDRLIVGPPGSGKTFLIRKLVLEGWGLFATSTDPAEIARALRAQRPGVVVVDDAHLDPERVVELRRLREELGAEFSIVATAWKGEGDEVAELLNLTDSQIRELELLTRNEIVEVVENCGLRGPVELVREIVDQAEGRPGLAVTLAYLCLRGGVREVALGEPLRRSTVDAFRRMVGEEATQILAAFALGGEAGMHPRVVSGVLELPLHKLHSALVRLAAGGVIDKARSAAVRAVGFRADAGDNPDQEHLTVRPPSLRPVLVRDVFFGAAPRLPHEDLVEAAPDVSEVACTLARAAAYGASVPPALLIATLERANDGDAWAQYAALGEAQANRVLTDYPEFTMAVAKAALVTAPRETLRRLLDLATEDERPLHPFPEHPLHKIEGWIRAAAPWTGLAVPRRKLLLEAAEEWIATGGDEQVGLRAILMTVSPAFSSYTTDPGSGITVTFTEGLLSPEELREVQALWPKVVALIGALSTVSWQEVLRSVESWAYPSRHVPQKQAPEWMVAYMRPFAERMLADVVRLADGHPGVNHRAAELVERLGMGLEIKLDPQFETLFPTRELGYDPSRQGRQMAAVRELAAEWSAADPARVVQTLSVFEAAAEDVDVRYPRWTPLLCEEIANRTEKPGTWLRAAIEIGLKSDLAAPFLRRAAALRDKGWEEAVRVCLGRPDLEVAAIHVLLTAPDPPPGLLSEALDKLERYPEHIETYCMRGEVPKTTLVRLLRHRNPKVAAAAAVGEWYAAPEGWVQEGLFEEWRGAILGAPEDEDMLGDILKADPALARDWLIARLKEKDDFGYLNIGLAVEGAVTTLNREQRLAVLREVRPGYGYWDLVSYIVVNDLALYGKVLEDEELGEIHLWPLAGHPVGNWIEKAKLALKAGHTPQEVATAAYGHSWGWTGSESAYWGGWADEFAALLSHEDDGIRCAAEFGRERAKRRQQAALKRERLEAVYGR
jgi:hypothetical protein